MTKRDARFLTSEAQEALRIPVVEVVRGGMSQTEPAGVFGVSRSTGRNIARDFVRSIRPRY